MLRALREGLGLFKSDSFHQEPFRTDLSNLSGTVSRVVEVSRALQDSEYEPQELLPKDAVRTNPKTSLFDNSVC